jgi:uncharacterized membrane protein
MSLELGRAEATAVVESPFADLFNFTDWCYNDPKWAPSIRKAWIVKLPNSDGLGKISHYVGNVKGRDMEWDGELVLWRENELWSMKAKTGLLAKMNMQNVMRFERVGTSRTKVTCTITFRSPYPLVGLFIDRFYLQGQAKQLAINAVEGMKRAASQRLIPATADQMEARKVDHPGYSPMKAKG